MFIFFFYFGIILFMVLGFIVNVFNNGKMTNACLLFEGLIKWYKNVNKENA